ncbi:MAG: tRNA (adenosine(37)-N6)-dimethylallyltransferase MiaA [Oscillospiraceae bacterium]|nr:tRNA (adenosine(37)-N6)-dimethylallyltransferase MiaA [Oscillospiraceae bacterium]
MGAEERIPLLVVAGPTASGKTEQGVRLCEALGGEVVSADSMQVYQGMEIATAKPTLAEMRGIPHHLIGFLPAAERFSLAHYTALANAAIADIHSRGKLPVLVGGTGLYIRAVAENLILPEGKTDFALREALAQRFASEGGAALWRELAAADPAAAAKTHPNDQKRIVRALELRQSMGLTLTEQNEASRLAPSPYDCRILLLGMDDRPALYSRVNRRVDSMLAAGLLEEARAFLAQPAGATAAQAIGYKELAPCIRGEATLAEATERLKMETRRYAKRQLSWFRTQCPQGAVVPARQGRWVAPEATIEDLHKWKEETRVF